MHAKKNMRSSLAIAAYEKIKSAICEGIIHQGDLLSENQIAIDLGMSRTPVREALRMLVSEDIVEIKNGIGIYVKTLSPRDVKDVFAVRNALETLAATTAIYEITNEEIDNLEQRFMLLLENYRRGVMPEPHSFSNLDWELHNLLVDRCRNNYVKSIMRSIHFTIKRCQLLSFEALNDIGESTEHHLEILSQIRKRDIEALTKALNDHIIWSANVLLDRM